MPFMASHKRFHSPTAYCVYDFDVVAIAQQPRRMLTARHDFTVDLDSHFAFAVTGDVKQRTHAERCAEFVAFSIEHDRSHPGILARARVRCSDLNA